MRIGLFSPNKNPYSETFVQAHKNGLQDEVFYFYGSGFGTQLEGHPPLASNLKNLRLRLQSKFLGKPYSFVKNTLLKDALKRYQIDVLLVEYGIHAHTLLPVIKEAKLPLVVHFHGFDASAYEAIEQCDGYKDVFAYSSKVIAVSKVMQQMLIDLGCPPEKIVYTPCGPRPFFKEVVLNDTPNYFFSMGRFVDKKAPYYTLLAFKKVVGKFPKARLKMAGDGPLLNACKNLSVYLGLQNQVDFLGVVTSQEVEELFASSIAFVQHSVRAENGDMEGTPVSIMEASLAGLPVIATKHGGIPEVILHEQTGLLCEEHDVDAMASYMISLLENPNLAKKLGAEGSKYIFENFRLEKHLQLLQEALNDSQRTSL